MAKIQNISEIHPTLGFAEFDILEKYPRDLMRVSLASFIRSFRLNVWQKPQACRTGDWAAGTFSFQSFHKARPYGPEGIHRILRQATGGTSER